MYREKPVICHNEAAVSRNPTRMNSRLSTLWIMRATKNIATLITVTMIRRRLYSPSTPSKVAA